MPVHLIWEGNTLFLIKSNFKFSKGILIPNRKFIKTLQSHDGILLFIQSFKTNMSFVWKPFRTELRHNMQYFQNNFFRVININLVGSSRAFMEISPFLRNININVDKVIRNIWFQIFSRKAKKCFPPCSVKIGICKFNISIKEWIYKNQGS